jgi:hypothetical protein
VLFATESTTAHGNSTDQEGLRFAADDIGDLT